MAVALEMLPRLAELFPRSAVTAVGVPGRIEGQLYEEESATIAGAVPARRLEFTAGRLCARRALEGLGFVARPILRRDDRTPVWPDGVVGSISHTRGLCGAVVAPAESLAGIGLDIEVADACAPQLARRVLTAVERERVAALEGPSDSGLWRTTIFSAKESVYKALFGLARVREFEDVEVTPRPEKHEFIARLIDGRRLTGTFRHSGGWVVTGVAIPAVVFDGKTLDTERSEP